MFSTIIYQLSATAIENGFNNEANEDVLTNIEELDEFLDEAYEDWSDYSKFHGIPELEFRVLSGYRCKELNDYLGMSETSAHLTGSAVDLTVDNTDFLTPFYDWASDFAKKCAEAGKDFDQIILEGVGSRRWLHISLKNYKGLSSLKQSFVKIDEGKYQKICYGTEEKEENEMASETVLTKDPVLVEHENGNRPTYNEIEGQKGENQMDLSVMPASYMRLIYIAKRLMSSCGFNEVQACGIIGNLLFVSDGRLATIYNVNGKCGIGGWDYTKQIKYQKFFPTDGHLYDGNLMNQTTFLVKEIINNHLVASIKKTTNVNDACIRYFQHYIHYGERLDMSELNTRRECSARRAYAQAAIEIYKAYVDQYKDEWLVGYYVGNGTKNDVAIQKTDDTKLWNSRAVYETLDLEELAEFQKKVDEKYKVLEKHIAENPDEYISQEL